jgi:predicted RNase H-like HicB family nuclease
VSAATLRTAVHAKIVSDPESGYVTSCDEIAVVTQGESPDNAIANLREAVGLHFEGEDMAALGFVVHS